jgi:3-phenylpropionate/trans-cinnamate dioxygenase ferredoxin component
MKYVKVAQTNELSAGNKKKIFLENKAILLTNIQGNYYAIDNTCPHMGGSLYDGNLNGNKITCPRHGSVFDVRTGKVVHRGKILFVKVKVNDVEIYPIKIEETDILIGIE